MQQSQWIEDIRRNFEPKPQYLIPILQFIQKEAGYLAPEAMLAAARYLHISESKVYGVASFYAQFYFEPRGRNKVTVCRGTACHVRGSGRILRDLEKHLGVAAGGTTGDLSFTLETVACFGACALAPVAVINGRVYGRQNSTSLKKIVDSVGAADRKKPAVTGTKRKRVRSKRKQ